MRHELDGTGIAIVAIRSGQGGEWRVGLEEWRSAVFEFADQVSAFYAACSLKRPGADDTAGFAKFRAEWERRRGRPLGAALPDRYN